MLSDIAPPATDLATLTERFRPALWRYVRTLGADAAAADDVVQEAFVVVLRRERFDASSPRAVFHFLRTTARYVWLRAGAGRVKPEDLRALTALKNLRRVELLQCAVTDEHLAALPESLTSLRLRGLELTPDGFRTVKK